MFVLYRVFFPATSYIRNLRCAVHLKLIIVSGVWVSLRTQTNKVMQPSKFCAGNLIPKFWMFFLTEMELGKSRIRSLMTANDILPEKKTISFSQHQWWDAHKNEGRVETLICWVYHLKKEKSTSYVLVFAMSSCRRLSF